MLKQGSYGHEKHLQFIAECPIHLPQLPKLVSLIYILGQPACPEMVDQRPFLSHISYSLHGYCTLTGLTKPWPVMQMCAAQLSITVYVVSVVVPVIKYHRGRVVVLPTLCIWPVIQW